MLGLILFLKISQKYGAFETYKVIPAFMHCTMQYKTDTLLNHLPSLNVWCMQIYENIVKKKKPRIVSHSALCCYCQAILWKRTDYQENDKHLHLYECSIHQLMHQTHSVKWQSVTLGLVSIRPCSLSIKRELSHCNRDVLIIIVSMKEWAWPLLCWYNMYGRLTLL